MILKDRRYYGQPPIGEQFASDDARLETDVASLLASDAEIDATDVAVTVRNGRLTIVGQVGRSQEVARCTDIALRVAGVVAIDNLVEARGADATANSGRT